MPKKNKNPDEIIQTNISVKPGNPETTRQISPEELETTTDEQRKAWAATQREAFSPEATERGKRLLEEQMPAELIANMAQTQKDILSASFGAIDVLKDHITSQISELPEPKTEEEERKKAELLEALPHLLSVIPEKHLIPNNKLTNTLTADIINAGRVAIGVSKPKAKQQIDIICDLIYEGDKVKLSGRRPFTEYDRNVYNAVTSLFVYGDQSHIVTPDIVYRTMTGMSATEDPSPQQTGAVTRSLDKMRFIRATVDCTEELKQRRISLNGEYVTNGIIDTYLLNASVIQVQAGGRTVRAYKIDKTPVLYVYSNALHQVYTVPATLLDVKAVDSKTGKISSSRVDNTESRIQVKGYLLRRIEGLKGKNALANRVISLQSYDKNEQHHPGLYEIAGKINPSPTEATRIRNYVTQVLNYWKAREYIKGYTWKKQGRQITGIEINL